MYKTKTPNSEFHGLNEWLSVDIAGSVTVKFKQSVNESCWSVWLMLTEKMSWLEEVFMVYGALVFSEFSVLFTNTDFCPVFSVSRNPIRCDFSRVVFRLLGFNHDEYPCRLWHRPHSYCPNMRLCSDLLVSLLAPLAPNRFNQY